MSIIIIIFYNGHILCDRDTGEFLIYDRKEKRTWEVIVILPGVEVIPFAAFGQCAKVKFVIMHDSVRRIEKLAFLNCTGLK